MKMDGSNVRKNPDEDAVNCMSEEDQYEANVRPLFASNKDKIKKTFSIDYILGLSSHISTSGNDQSGSYNLKCESTVNEINASESNISEELNSSIITKCNTQNTLVSNFLYPGWTPNQLESIRSNYCIGFTNELCKYYMHIG